MKPHLSYLVILMTVLFSCKKEPDVPYITMTTLQGKNGEVRIQIAGAGSVTIDWGDSSPNETHTLKRFIDYDWAFGGNYRYSHSYPEASSCIIKVTGENITHFNCSESAITSIDASRVTALKLLACYKNHLETLDVSKNIALQMLNCGWNQIANLDLSNNTSLFNMKCHSNNLSTEALIFLIGTLHDNTIDGRYKSAGIYDNPGASAFANEEIINGWTIYSRYP